MKPYYQDEYVTLYCGDCMEVMPKLGQGAFSACLTDPPYEYIKSLDWDQDGFDKNGFVTNIVSLLAKNSMIAMFGRGPSFYRLNCLLEDAGLKFKEEVIWNKIRSTSPCMALHRVHETISIFSKGKGVIQRSKIPYLEKKQYDISSICMDIKRISSALKNPQELKEILNFLELNGKVEIYNKCRVHKHQISQQKCFNAMRGVATIAQVKTGMSESSIIRTDMEAGNHTGKHNITVQRKIGDGARYVNTMQSVSFGMTETSIIEQHRDHYNLEHPTQKPVRLFERILNLICCRGDSILDPFAGSGTTGVAAKLLNRKCVLIEKEERYCEIAARRLSQGVLPLFE